MNDAVLFSSSLTINREEVTRTSTNSGLLLRRENESGESESYIAGVDYNYDSRRIEPDERTHHILGLSFDCACVGSDANYVRGDVSYTNITRLGLEDKSQLISRIKLGAVQSFDAYTTRTNDRYLISTNDLRGYSYRGVGPRDTVIPSNSTGNPIPANASHGDALGGNRFALASTEARFGLGLPEQYRITGAAFIDAASVWDIDFPSEAIRQQAVLTDDAFDIRGAAGFSIIWQSALGPLRFNWTKAFSAASYDKTDNFAFTLATNF